MNGQPSNAGLVVALVGLSRFSFRLLAALLRPKQSAAPDTRPVLIYGAGDGGLMPVHELTSNPEHRYQPVGFIDDDAGKSGRRLCGYHIFNSRELPRLIEAHGIHEILVSSGKVPESRLNDLRSLGVAFKRLRIQLD